jgi:hypothetical protein
VAVGTFRCEWVSDRVHAGRSLRILGLIVGGVGVSRRVDVGGLLALAGEEAHDGQGRRRSPIAADCGGVD